MDGTALDIGSAFGQKLALVLHELATNAAKYGSLSIPGGRVLVSWHIEQSNGGGEALKFSWVERDGPAVKPPADQGFGMQLIAALLDNTSRVSFRERGFEFNFQMPLSKVMQNDK
jgi:two-component system CheB/CheR fusion protein